MPLATDSGGTVASPTKGLYPMHERSKDYVLAVQAPAHSLGHGRFAMESAFVVHIRELKARLLPPFARIVVMAPELSKEQYEASGFVFGHLSEAEDGVAFVPMRAPGRRHFWAGAGIPAWRHMRSILATAGYVHSGLSWDIRAPDLFLLNFLAWRRRIPTTFVVDIDFRKTSRRYHALGLWSGKSYAVNRLLHDPFKRLQVWLAARMSSLVLLKSSSMVEDYGRGQPNVRDFLDAAHSARDVVSDEALDARLAHRAAQRRFAIVYFGRMVPNKGIDIVIEALELATRQGADVHLTLVGGGESVDELRRRAQCSGLQNAVTFVPPVAYGDQLFEIIDRADVAVAAPRVEDTPRAALDAMARGLPIVAFDIDYFKYLADRSGAVALAAWPSADSLSTAITRLARDRETVATMARRAVVFARANTQEIWLNKRLTWTLDAYASSGSGRRT